MISGQEETMSLSRQETLVLASPAESSDSQAHSESEQNLRLQLQALQDRQDPNFDESK